MAHHYQKKFDRIDYGYALIFIATCFAVLVLFGVLLWIIFSSGASVDA